MKLFPFKVLFRSCLLKPSVWDPLTWSALKDGVSPGGKDTNKSVVQTFFFFFTNYLCICISFLAVLGARRCAGLLLIAALGASLSLVAVRRLLIALASLAAEQRIEGTWAPRL